MSKLIRASDIQFDAELLCPMNGNIFIKVDDVSRVIASISGVDAVSRDTIEEIKKNILFIKDKCLSNNIAERYEQKGLQEALNIIEYCIKENADGSRHNWNK